MGPQPKYGGIASIIPTRSLGTIIDMPSKLPHPGAAWIESG